MIRFFLVVFVLLWCSWFWREGIRLMAIKRANDARERLEKFLEQNDLWHPESQRLLEEAIRRQEHYLAVWKLSNDNVILKIMKAWRKPGPGRRKLSHLRVVK